MQQVQTMKYKTTYTILLSTILFSCGRVSENKQVETDTSQTVATIIHDTASPYRKLPYKSISEVIEPSDKIKVWHSENFDPQFFFSLAKDTLFILFNGQCSYGYPYKIKEDKIIAYWDFIEDCTHDISIKKTFGLKNHPVVGKPFMVIQLANDTTLKVDYLYPEWTKKFNAVKDSQAFPDYLHMPEL